MKFIVERVTGGIHEKVEINTVEQLMKLSEQHNCEKLILSFFVDNLHNTRGYVKPMETAEILVYDDYIE